MKWNTGISLAVVVAARAFQRSLNTAGTTASIKFIAKILLSGPQHNGFCYVVAHCCDFISEEGKSKMS